MANIESTTQSISDKVRSGHRLSLDEGLHLHEHADLFTLGKLANFVREKKNGNVGYYNVNVHLNPTNVCVYRCTSISCASCIRNTPTCILRLLLR